MNRFSKFRRNMVENQLRAGGVKNENVLDAFDSIHRELFVSEGDKGICYGDGEVSSSVPERFLLAPLVHGRMVEAVSPGNNDVVLDIGSGSGYSAAIWSRLVCTVIALDNCQTFPALASSNWEKSDVCNVAGFYGSPLEGLPENGVYDIIFFNGAISTVPDSILPQLSSNGRLIAVIKTSKDIVPKVTLIRRKPDGNFVSEYIFDAFSSYLSGFEPELTFAFD